VDSLDFWFGDFDALGENAQMSRPPEPDITDLDTALSSCWTLLGRGVADRRHGFHHPVVANVSIEGRPRARVVVLRQAERTAKTLRFHTDVRSQKWEELKQVSGVAVSLYDEAARVQIKIEGRAALHCDDAIADAAWASSQKMSRVCYGTTPSPGTAVGKGNGFELPSEDAEIAAGRANFGAVVIHIEKLEWLFLRVGGHRRAHFDFQSQTAQWLVP
jgi:pyridoxamine 5'-phosphate oxidase